MNNRKKINLCHAENDDAFSKAWGNRYCDKSDYPIWTAMCNELAAEIEADGSLHKVIASLTEKAGFHEVNGCPAHRESTCSCLYKKYKDNDPEKVFIDKLKCELNIWSLESIRKLVQDCLRYYVENQVLTDKAKYLADHFVELLITFINEINACYPVCSSRFYINRASEEYKRFDNNIRRADVAQIIEEFQAAALLVATSANSAASSADSTSLDLVSADSSPTDSSSADLVLADSASVDSSLADSTSSADLATVSSVQAAAPVAEVQVARPSRRNWVTPTMMALGAIAGVVALGIVVVATHGIALPFIASAGTAVMLGHGSMMAGLGVGFSLFGAASAVVGAVSSFVTKKMCDVAAWLHGEDNSQTATVKETTPLLDSTNKQRSVAVSGTVSKIESKDHVKGRETHRRADASAYGSLSCCGYFGKRVQKLPIPAQQLEASLAPAQVRLS